MLDNSSFVVGVSNPLQARLLASLGYNSAWISGYSVAGECFASADCDVISYAEKSSRQREIILSTDLHYYVDIDAGLSNAEALKRYVTQLSHHRVAGVCVEDEPIPKRSTLYSNQLPSISAEEFVDRLGVLAEMTEMPIIARSNMLAKGASCEQLLRLFETLTEHCKFSGIAFHLPDISLLAELKSLRSFGKEIMTISSLLPDVTVDEFATMEVDKLIVAHHLLFAQIEASRQFLLALSTSRRIPALRSATQHLIQHLVEHVDVGSGDRADLNGEMKAYYQHRAHEYHHWYDRLGAYSKDHQSNQRWFSSLQWLEGHVDAIEGHNILELAAGTGRWTTVLATRNSVTIVDSSPAMIEINTSGVNVKSVCADIYRLTVDQPQHFDACFFAFWISHVPEERLEEFFASVSRNTGPSPTIYIVDSVFNPAEVNSMEYVDNIQTRALSNGHIYRVYKKYYSPKQLRETLAPYVAVDWIKSDDYFFVLKGTLVFGQRRRQINERAAM